VKPLPIISEGTVERKKVNVGKYSYRKFSWYQIYGGHNKINYSCGKNNAQGKDE